MASHNPYAPPVADVDAPPDGAEPRRDGRLVRMGIGARFPDRCVRCNQPAASYRVARSLYWRPTWFRWTAVVVLLVLFVASGASVLVSGLFVLSLAGFAVADMFLRRRIVIELPLCARHRRLRAGVMAAFVASWIVLIGLSVAGASGLRAVEQWWYWAGALAMFLLGIVAALLYRVWLSRLTEHHLWLGGAGRAFCEALPAVGGD